MSFVKIYFKNDDVSKYGIEGFVHLYLKIGYNEVSFSKTMYFYDSYVLDIHY